jgi:hypothetical protein
VAEPSTDSTKAGIERLRETAKWLIGAYAAVGTVLIAGLQLTSLGKIEDETRLWIAIGTAFVALVAVTVAIWKVTDVLGPVKVAKADLDPDSPAGKMAKDTPSLLKGQALDLASLQTRYEVALNDYQVRRDKARGDPTAVPEAEQAYKLVLAVTDPLAEMRNIALFEKLKQRFDEAKRWLGATAVLTAACVIAFAWAANPSEESQATAKAQEHGPTIATPSLVTLSVDPRRLSLKALRAQLGARCNLARVHAVIVGGTTAEPEVLTLPKQHCRDVRFVVSEDIGVALPTK